MKVILSGYEGSKVILEKSSFLLNKYMAGFDIRFINFGEYTGNLYCGKYVNVGKTQLGGVQSWSKYVREYLMRLADEKVIYSLDDFLISTSPKDYDTILNAMDSETVCARLCVNDFYKPHEKEDMGNGLFRLTPKAEYSVTCQYSIWNREYLISLLERVHTPWEFEIDGSKILNKEGRKVIAANWTCIEYLDTSALSARWEGIRLSDKNKEDLCGI